MIRMWARIAGSGIIGLGLAASPSSRAGDRSPVEILHEIDGLKTPELDLAREDDPDYIRRFRAARAVVRIRRAEAIAELHRVDPGNPSLVKLLPVRWRGLSGRLGGPDDNAGARDLTGELDEVLAGPAPRPLRVEAAYIKAWIGGDPFDRIGALPDKDAKAKAVDAFITFAPGDVRGAELLYLLGLAHRGNPAKQRPIWERIVATYPESERAEVARGLIRKLDLAGKPLDLAFRDAIGGSEVSISGLRGKVVVVDFWATWCAPCVAEMPRMKEIEARYRDRGVAFLGVSLDEPEADGGLDRLKGFVARNAIPWPQYYQGAGWDSPFSKGLGITAVPTIFVVDREGRIASIDAGEGLEAILEGLIGRPGPAGR